MAAAGGGAAAGRAYSFKVVLLGEGCVGKTSLVLRYCENKFNDKHITTLQDTAGQERFHALGPIYYRDSNGAILVYDITDEDSFQKEQGEVEKPSGAIGASSHCSHPLTARRDQDRHQVPTVGLSSGSISGCEWGRRRQQVQEPSKTVVKNWVKELRKMLGNEICLCIVGNKIDLEKERHVSIQEAESYAESVGAKHYHTSAKQNKGIEELFLDLCKRMIETAQVDERAKGNGSSQPGAARRGVQIIDDEPQVQSGGGGCCSSG
ncbi:hypothetical protein QTO34_017308 [Cnephaeus nilssonii]|nr:hypothetical protein QTO34_017308 [Eptesicus nilssonii]